MMTDTARRDQRRGVANGIFFATYSAPLVAMDVISAKSKRTQNPACLYLTHRPLLILQMNFCATTVPD